MGATPRPNAPQDPTPSPTLVIPAQAGTQADTPQVAPPLPGQGSREPHVMGSRTPSKQSPTPGDRVSHPIEAVVDPM